MYWEVGRRMAPLRRDVAANVKGVIALSPPPFSRRHTPSFLAFIATSQPEKSAHCQLCFSVEPIRQPKLGMLFRSMQKICGYVYVVLGLDTELLTLTSMNSNTLFLKITIEFEPIPEATTRSLGEARLPIPSEAFVPQRAQIQFLLASHSFESTPIYLGSSIWESL